MSSDDLWTDAPDDESPDNDAPDDDAPNDESPDDDSRNDSPDGRPDGTADGESPDDRAAPDASAAAGRGPDSVGSDSDAAGPDADLAGSDADLARQVELLAAENRRLRSEYEQVRRSTHRRTAAGLAAVGVVALLGAVAFAGSRTVLFALGFTGLFGAVLTYFLTPERFVSAEVGERVYAASARTGDLLVGELGLRDVRVYVPAPDADESPVRLFVPNATDYDVPDRGALADLFVVTDDRRERGVSLHPTGGLLYREFESAVADEAVEAPADAGRQLADALVEVFELAGSATADVDSSGGRLTVAVADSAYGAVDRFDHPVASLVAVGMAETLDAPVTMDVTPTEDGDGDYLITCEWDADRRE